VASKSGPSQRQKRWSGRLRTAGALLTLLGAVGLGDAATSGFGSWPLAAALVAGGLVLYVLGRRWTRLGSRSSPGPP
jgi:hypothetical protein